MQTYANRVITDAYEKLIRAIDLAWRQNCINWFDTKILPATSMQSATHEFKKFFQGIINYNVLIYAQEMNELLISTIKNQFRNIEHTIFIDLWRMKTWFEEEHLLKAYLNPTKDEFLQPTIRMFIPTMLRLKGLSMQRNVNNDSLDFQINFPPAKDDPYMSIQSNFMPRVNISTTRITDRRLTWLNITSFFNQKMNLYGIDNLTSISEKRLNLGYNGGI